MEKAITRVEPAAKEMTTADINKTLTEEDWDLLIKNAPVVNFTKDKSIVNFSEENTKLWYIVKGSCRVELVKNGKKIVLCTMEKGEKYPFL